MNQDFPHELIRETPETKRAWGEALIKTGTEHLDLSMVRHGRKVLKDAEAEIAAKGHASNGQP